MKESEHVCEHKHRKKAILCAYFAIFGASGKRKKQALKKKNEHFYGSKKGLFIVGALRESGPVGHGPAILETVNFNC